MSNGTSTRLSETFNCPHCGGEIQYDGQSATQRCAYCGASVPVPAELRPKRAPSIQVFTPVQYSNPTRRTSNAGCWLIGGFVVFMIVVTTVLPLVAVFTSIPKFSVEMPRATVAPRPTVVPATAAPTPAVTPTPAFATAAVKIGSEGMGAGQFTRACLSGLDGAGHIYVGEYSGSRIQVFDSTGKFINQFFADDENSVLLGLAVDRKGVVYAAGGADITRYDGATGKSLGKLKYSGGPGFGELALAPDGSLYAMWYQRRNGIFTSVEGAREDLVHFDGDGKVIKVIAGVISSMTDSVELENPLAVDGRGNVYVDPGFEDQIFKFDATGKFITRLGHSGGAMAVDGQGRLFVAYSGEIAMLKPDGSRLDQFNIPGTAHSLMFDDAGAVWVTSDNDVAKYQLNEK